MPPHILIMIVWCMLLSTNAIADPKFSTPFALAPNGSSSRSNHATILGAVAIAGVAPDGMAIHGLSGLAWDQDESLLYAVSDFGYLVWLIPRITGGQLTEVDYRGHYALRDQNGANLAQRRHDAEGLMVQGANNGRTGDTELVISFEQRPRVLRFSPTGKFVQSIRLPATLRRSQNYFDLNHGLEAITWHPRFGILVGTETALRGQPAGTLAILSMSGLTWSFPAAARGSALVGMETTADGEIVVLERRYLSPWQPLIISLRVVALESRPPPIRELAQFSSAQGWAVDNFEGIARYDQNHYFLVSDDNANPLQKTLLVFLTLTAPDH